MSNNDFNPNCLSDLIKDFFCSYEYTIYQKLKVASDQYANEKNISRKDAASNIVDYISMRDKISRKSVLEIATSEVPEKPEYDSIPSLVALAFSAFMFILGLLSTSVNIPWVPNIIIPIAVIIIGVLYGYNALWKKRGKSKIFLQRDEGFMNLLNILLKQEEEKSAK